MLLLASALLAGFTDMTTAADINLFFKCIRFRAVSVTYDLVHL